MVKKNKKEIIQELSKSLGKKTNLDKKTNENSHQFQIHNHPDADQIMSF